MAELKFVITGTAGVGKTTAISAISDVPPVITDEMATDDLSAIKENTTVAFDFGELVLDDDTVVRVYGTPGQERFRHMWEILAEGALGLVILVDDRREDPVYDMGIYFENFDDLIRDSSVVVGVTRADESDPEVLDKYYSWLKERNIFSPVLAVDPRKKEDISLLMDALVSMLEFA